MQKEKNHVTERQGSAGLRHPRVIGKVDDFYFDEEDWGIPYLVVDTGSWLSGGQVRRRQS